MIECIFCAPSKDIVVTGWGLVQAKLMEQLYMTRNCFGLESSTLPNGQRKSQTGSGLRV